MAVEKNKVSHTSVERGTMQDTAALAYTIKGRKPQDVCENQSCEWDAELLKSLVSIIFIAISVQICDLGASVLPNCGSRKTAMLGMVAITVLGRNLQIGLGFLGGS